MNINISVYGWGGVACQGARHCRHGGGTAV